MAKFRTRKWLDNIAPDENIGRAAKRTLKMQLFAVEHFLPRAASRPEKDSEYVHNLRVWSRRSMVALDLYAELLPEARTRWIRKQLKRLRDAASEARDYDVLSTLPLEEKLLKQIRRHRAKAQKPLRAIHEKLTQGGRFERQVEKLLRGLRRVHKDEASRELQAWGQARLKPVAENFFKAAPGPGGDLLALHNFRIRGKELCYSMEMLSGAFPPAFRAMLYPQVQGIQEKLGEINDLATLQERLQEVLAEAPDSPAKEKLRALLAKKQKRLVAAVKKFSDWCTPQLLAHLRAEFLALLPPAAVKPEKPQQDTPDDSEKYRLIGGARQAA